MIDDARKGQDVAAEVPILDKASANTNLVTMRIPRPGNTYCITNCPLNESEQESVCVNS